MNTQNMSKLVAIAVDDNCAYPTHRHSFSPSVRYPEYPFDDIAAEENAAYGKVRECLAALGLDSGHYGTKRWNPLGEFISPGDKVVVKPNWVMHVNPEERCGSMEALVTNPSVLRAALDYVLIALKGRGRIIVGDAPMYQCDLQKLLEEMHFNDLWAYYQGKTEVEIGVLDFRDLVINRERPSEANKVIVGDSGIFVDLGKDSCLDAFSESQIRDFRIFGYSTKIMRENHAKGVHRYAIHRDVLDADVIINMPKCKTHRKAGLTACAKNLVGVSCRKEYLPHHRTGSAAGGGDEYPHRNLFKTIHTKIQERYSETLSPSLALRFARKFSRGLELVLTRDKKYDGCWYGNDTLWRTVADLNRIVECADRNGALRREPQRKIFNICDMIVAGEGEGPLRPAPKPLGAIICGASIPAVDRFVCELAGLDYRRIKYIPFLLAQKQLDADGVEIASGDGDVTALRDYPFRREWRFAPASGWKGHVERD